MKGILTFAFFLLLCGHIFAQIITEVLFNYPYEKEICQYIEIFNSSTNSVDLREFSILVQGYEVKITNIFLSELETEGITNSFLLKPGQFAVILPYSYSLSSKPFFFPTNAVILTTSTKYLARATPLNEEILSTIKLLSNGTVIDSVVYSSTSGKGITIERNGDRFVLSEKPSFGFWGKNKSMWFSKPLYEIYDSIELFLSIDTNTDSVDVEVLGRATITLTRVSGNTFKASLTPGHNGERIVARFGEMVSTARVLNLFETSTNLGKKLLLNEVCFSPTKRWVEYFQGGSGVGPAREGDKYVEIVNISSEEIPITNLYLHGISTNTEIILNLSTSVFYSSKRGFSTILGYAEPYEYLLISAPGISSNMTYMLKDGHPYKGGKILHFLENKTLRMIPFSHSNIFIFSGNPTVSLLPNAFSTEFGGRFLNWQETPARYNGFANPSIIVDSKYKTVGTKVKIFVVEDPLENVALVRVYTKSTKISRVITLTNFGFWYYGEFLISTNQSDVLFVGENDEVTLEYYKTGKRFYETFFVIPSNAISVSIEGSPIVERSVVKVGEPVRLINVDVGDRVKFFTRDGYFVKEFEIQKAGIYELDSSLFIRRGIYFIEHTRGKVKSFFKILILD
ncbi:MAG: hypothetical protein ABDH28_05365 [Brevinematia bacterium]